MSLKQLSFTKISTLLSVSMLCLVVGACSRSTNTNTNEANVGDMAHFEGCYTIDKTALAQIKISQQDGRFVMQMKEPSTASTTWDAPEILDEISVDKAWEYFGVNALSLDKSDIEHVLSRQDGLMVLAKVKSASHHINPLLDSPYVVYIFRGANTIYQVACDDTPLDIVGG